MTLGRPGSNLKGNRQPIDRVIQSHSANTPSRGATESRTPTLLDGNTSQGVIESRTPTQSTLPPTLNHAIGIILASYTRAINQQRKTTGSLFRQKTKADCITLPQEISPSYYNLGFGTSIRLHDPQKEYPQACFNYIHQNPVKAGLVKLPEDWEFSSYRDICGLRNGKIINKKRIDEFGLISSRGAIENSIQCE